MIGTPPLPPPFQPVVMQCSTMAAEEYQVPRILVLAVIRTESRGNPKAINYNKNNTVDVGPMQINTTWARRLSKEFGITSAHYHLKNNTCYNIRVGTWVLKLALTENPSLPYWQRVGNYHSHTPKYNAKYSNQVRDNMNWLINNTNWKV